jgi:tetratricopeptide (TPR) repeat protein
LNIQSLQDSENIPILRLGGATKCKKITIKQLMNTTEAPAPSANRYTDLGIRLHEFGKTIEAIACFKKAIEIKPTSSEAICGLGDVFLTEDKRGEAISCYQHAVEINPRHTHAFNQMGVALEKQGKTELAVICFRKALNIDDSLPRVHCNLGSALKTLGKKDEAVACYLYALEIEPACVEAHYLLENLH